MGIQYKVYVEVKHNGKWHTANMTRKEYCSVRHPDDYSDDYSDDISSELFGLDGFRGCQLYCDLDRAGTETYTAERLLALNLSGDLFQHLFYCNQEDVELCMLQKRIQDTGGICVLTLADYCDALKEARDSIPDYSLQELCDGLRNRRYSFIHGSNYDELLSLLSEIAERVHDFKKKNDCTIAPETDIRIVSETHL